MTFAAYKLYTNSILSFHSPVQIQKALRDGCVGLFVYLHENRVRIPWKILEWTEFNFQSHAEQILFTIVFHSFSFSAQQQLCLCTMS